MEYTCIFYIFVIHAKYTKILTKTNKKSRMNRDMKYLICIGIVKRKMCCYVYLISTVSVKGIRRPKKARTKRSRDRNKEILRELEYIQTILKFRCGHIEPNTGIRPMY